MTDCPPHACSLAPDDFRRRLAEIAALADEALLGQSADGDAQVLRFRADPGTRRRLEGLVAAESECCPWLDLDLTRGDDELVLRVTAPVARGG
jgi:hypothetical protein